MNKSITQFELLNSLVNNLHKFSITPTAKLVLLYLAKCWNPGKGYMYPRITTISKTTGISESSVHRAIKELCKQGILLYDTKSLQKFVFTTLVFEKCQFDITAFQKDRKKAVNLHTPCHEQRIIKQNKKSFITTITTKQPFYASDQLKQTQALLDKYKSIKTASPLDMNKEQAIKYLKNLPPQLLRTPMNQKLIKKFML